MIGRCANLSHPPGALGVEAPNCALRSDGAVSLSQVIILAGQLDARENQSVFAGEGARFHWCTGDQRAREQECCTQPRASARGPRRRLYAPALVRRRRGSSMAPQVEGATNATKVVAQRTYQLSAASTPPPKVRGVACDKDTHLRRQWRSAASALRLYCVARLHHAPDVPCPPPRRSTPPLRVAKWM